MFWFDLFSRFDTATRAAAVGGVTTLVNTDFLLFFCNPNCNLSCDHILLIIQVDMPLNALPPTTSPENLATKVKVNTFWRIWRTWAQTRRAQIQDENTQVAAARGQCWVDVGFWGGVIPGNAHHLKVTRM